MLCGRASLLTKVMRAPGLTLIWVALMPLAVMVTVVSVVVPPPFDGDEGALPPQPASIRRTQGNHARRMRDYATRLRSLPKQSSYGEASAPPVY